MQTPRVCAPWLRLTVLAVGAAALVPTKASAQELGDIVKRLAASYPSGAKTQEAVDERDDARRQSEQDYVFARRRAEALRRYVEQLKTSRARQDERRARIEADIDQVVEVSRELLPLMERMVSTLGRFVGLDTPFLRDEREARIGRLRALLGETETPDAEKYRRVLEAYAIELEYGRTLETYRGRLDDEGPLVRFVRVGRVLLAFASLDGRRYGRWDTDEQAFVDLDPRFGPDIERAIAVAEERAPPEVLLLPVAAPKDELR